MFDAESDRSIEPSLPARDLREAADPLLSVAENPPSPQRLGNWGRWHRIATTALCGVAVILVADVIRRNWETVSMIAAGRIAWKWVAASIACLMSNQILALCRWIMLVHAVGIRWSTKTCFDVAITSEATSIIAPGANGGDIAKIAYTLRSPDERVKIAASIVCDRLSGLYGLLVVGCVAGALQWSTGSSAIRTITLVTVGTLVLSVVGATLALGPLRSWLFSLFPRRWPALNRIVDDLNHACSTYRSQPFVLAKAVAMSAVSQTLCLTAFFLIGAGLQPTGHARWETVLVGGPWVFLSTVLPLPFGALGVTEQVSEELFKALGDRGGGIGTLTYRVTLFASTLMLVSLWLVVRRAFRWNEK
jgi:hypothetical protein